MTKKNRDGPGGQNHRPASQSGQQRLHRANAKEAFLNALERHRSEVLVEFISLASIPKKNRRGRYKKWRSKWYLEAAEPGKDWINPIAWAMFRDADEGRDVSLLSLRHAWQRVIHRDPTGRGLEMSFDGRPKPVVCPPLETDDMKREKARPVARRPLETDEAFMRRAKEHSSARRAIFAAEGLLPHARPDLVEHVEWFVRYQMCRESYRQIEESLDRRVTKGAVQKAILGVADLLGFRPRAGRK